MRPCGNMVAENCQPDLDPENRKVNIHNRENLKPYIYLYKIYFKCNFKVGYFFCDIPVKRGMGTVKLQNSVKIFGFEL